jgi:hypothetical protein
MEARFIVNPSIYVSGQGFGVTWRISYAQVSAQARVSAAQLFEPEETEDVPQTAQVPQETETEEQVQEEEEETPAPAPAPAPVAATPAPAKVARRRPVGAAM